MKRLVVAAGLWAALALLGVDASAQTGMARGKVVDDKSQPVAEAVVAIEYQGPMTRKFETKTNKKGEYTQVGLPPGIYRFTANREGYQGAYVEARVGLGEPTYVPDIRITPRTGGQAGGGGEFQASFQKAVELTRAGKYDEAEAAYKELLVKSSSIPEVHYNLGYIYGQKKDWASAEAAYRKAIEIRPEYAEAYVALAKVYEDTGRGEKALEVMKQATTANPADGKVHFNLGVFHLNAGRSEDALVAFQKAAELDPGNAEVHYHLGTLAVGQNKVADAVAQLEKYLSMSPQNPQNVATAQALLQALKPKK